MQIKKVLIDARLYNETGVGTYTRNLLFQINQINPENIQFFAFILESTQLNTIYKNITFLRTKCKWHTMQEQILFNIE